MWAWQADGTLIYLADGAVDDDDQISGDDPFAQRTVAERTIDPATMRWAWFPVCRRSLRSQARTLRTFHLAHRCYSSPTYSNPIHSSLIHWCRYPSGC